MNEKTIPNKPLAYMAADVKAQASALRKNISDYPQRNLLEIATNASAKMLGIIQRRSDVEKYFFYKIWISR
jgi:hypothetical protein